MPKFGVDATGMSAVSGTNIFKMNVQEGVVDKSDAMRTAATTGLISDIGGMAVEAHKGYQMADIEAEQEKNISEYMARKQNPTVAIEAGYNASKLRTTVDTIWNNLDASIEEVNPIEKNFQDQLNVYKNASEQGVMSPDELSSRILKTTREAINKNPGLAKELKAHANSVLELSGISSIVEADKATAIAKQKTEDKMKDELRSLADKFDIPMNRFNPDYIGLQKQVQQVQSEKAIVTAADRATSFDENQFRTFGTSYMVGKYNTANEQAIAIMQDESQPYDRRIATVKLMFNSVRQGLMTDSRINRIIDKPSVQSSLKFVNDQIDSTLKTLESFSNKEDALKYLKNSTDLVRNQNYLDISKHLNPEAVDVMSKLLSTVGGARVAETNPEVMSKMISTFGNMVKGVSGGLGTNYNIRGTRGENLVTSALGQVARDSGTGNLNSTGALQKMIDVLHKDSKSIDLFPTTSDKFNFYNDYIKEIGKPENRDGFKKIDDLSRMKITENMDEYLSLTLNDMHKQVQYWEKQGAKIQWDVLPDGRLTLKTDKPEVMEDLTKRYVIRINDSVKALSNILDTSNQGAAGVIYPKYKDFFITPGTDMNKEINDFAVTITNKTKALDAFNKGKITNQEYKTIIKEMKK